MDKENSAFSGAMITWQEIDRAATNGSLDKSDLPYLQECRQVLDRHSNSGDASFQRVIQALRTRVGELIRVREQEKLDNRNAEADRKRHAESLELERKAILVSERANEISIESNRIAHRASCYSQVATAIALAALILSGFQYFLDWHYKSAKVNQTLPLAPPQPKTEFRTSPTNTAPLSILTNATLTNGTPPQKRQVQ